MLSSRESAYSNKDAFSSWPLWRWPRGGAEAGERGKNEKQGKEDNGSHDSSQDASLHPWQQAEKTVVQARGRVKPPCDCLVKKSPEENCRNQSLSRGQSSAEGDRPNHRARASRRRSAEPCRPAPATQ